MVSADWLIIWRDLVLFQQLMMGLTLRGGEVLINILNPVWSNLLVEFFFWFLTVLVNPMKSGISFVHPGKRIRSYQKDLLRLVSLQSYYLTKNGWLILFLVLLNLFWQCVVAMVMWFRIFSILFFWLFIDGSMAVGWLRGTITMPWPYPTHKKYSSALIFANGVS